MNAERIGDRAETHLSPAMPLMMVSDGQDVNLVEIRGGKEMTHRLAEMGLVPGVRLRVISNGHPGPFIINVKESRLMLGRGMAHRIFVDPA